MRHAPQTTWVKLLVIALATAACVTEARSAGVTVRVGDVTTIKGQRTNTSKCCWKD